MTSWKENAKAYLQRCYDCDFDSEFEFVKGKSFCQVIGAAIYGEQADGENVDGSDDKFGYSQQKSDHIVKIQNKMYELSPTKEIRVFKNMIYIYINDENQGPTIAFKFKAKSGYVFIDASCRIYSSWTDFLENNKLPECQIAYTNGGQFETDKDYNVLVEFGESPACSALSKLVVGTDITAGVLGVATTAVGVVGLFCPLTAPLSIACFVSGGITGIYGATRSTTSLIDRSCHEESISLADSEARLHWLNLVTAPLAVMGGVATMATKRIAASGQVLSNTAQFLVNSAIFSSFGMCSLNVINNLANLVEKAEQNELTVLDVSSFVISVAFWTNSAMNLQTANGIIKTTQREVLKGHQKGLNSKQSRQYRRMVQNTRDDTQARDVNNPLKRNTHDNAKCIRAMNQINDPKEFFQSSIAVNKEVIKQNRQFAKTNTQILAPVKLSLSLDDYNCMNINNQLKINPQKFYQISSENRNTIFKATVDFINDNDKSNFLSKVKGIKGIKFELQRNIAMQNFANILRTPNLQDYTCNGKKIFKDLKPHERNRIIQIENTLSQNDERFQRIAISFAEQKNPQTIGEYSSYVEYASAVLIEQKKEVDMTNWNKNEISRNNFQRNQVASRYIDAGNNKIQREFELLNNKYQDDYGKVKIKNDGLTKPFKSTDAATYHCKKHGHIKGLTSEEYMDKIQDIISNGATSEPTLTQEGDAYIVSYTTNTSNSRKQIQVLVIIDPELQEYTMTMFDVSL